ncbi:hypothetical protein RRG08_046429 [Elysia crispata]|uniref:Uncharacterized protein n=1 Tax=Elysia crispata TaxID=231223 RepID=A0AAE1DBQ1_9GAST|nr:hypothetical protein RRG08_046429 [Elysia crispata]
MTESLCQRSRAEVSKARTKGHEKAMRVHGLSVLCSLCVKDARLSQVLKLPPLCPEAILKSPSSSSQTGDQEV